MKTSGKIRLTIGAKLVGLIGLLLILSVTSIVWQSTRMFSEDTTDLIRQINTDTAGVLATLMREVLTGATSRMRAAGTVLVSTGVDPETTSKIVAEYFEDKHYLALFLVKHKDDGAPELERKAVSQHLNVEPSFGEAAFGELSSDKSFSFVALSRGEPQIARAKLPDGTAAVAVGLPFVRGSSEAFTHSIVTLLKQDLFVKAFADIDGVTTYMIDREGRLMAHPDPARAAAGESAAHLDIVKEMRKGQFNNSQMRYFDATAAEGKGEWRLGAFRMVGFAGLGVVAEVPELKAFDASSRVKYRSILIATVILAIAFFVGYLYSGSITWPIKQLMIAAGRIQEGDFAIQLTPKGNDELTHLSHAFNEMALGLEERDRVKETFNKFHNKEIAEKLLSGEVKLGGERRQATIFFSDVRGFTAMSESMEPEQVVEMLNEYMTRMVAIIRHWHGIVDKYVGDANMAIWGVPFGGEDDEYRAIRACIDMRAALAELNELRISRGHGVLKIGMGLNTGQVIAGNIGSTEKMEYTVIGDSVNLASRIESMTKEYGTDLLVSKNIYEKVKDRFVFETCKAAKVKGKSEAIEVFKVKGYFDENGQPVLVETPYSSYEAEKSDKVVHEKEPNPEASHEAPSDSHQATVAIAEATNTGIMAALSEDTLPSLPASSPTESESIAELIDRLPVPDPFALTEAPMPAKAATPPWYLLADGDVYGPFSHEDIQRGIAGAELTAEMLASRETENQQWKPLSEFEDWQGKFPASESLAS